MQSLHKNCYHTLLKLLALFLLYSCGPLKDSAKYQFSEGYYYGKFAGHKTKKLYLLTGSDSIKVYTPSTTRNKPIDTAKSITIAFPSNTKPLQFKKYSFSKRTFDLDVLSILFKYRPSVDGFPKQFNATFNGAIYTGFRTDIYKLNYKRTPLQIYKRSITHYGYSFGIFNGFGTARIDPYVTKNRIDIEYDGVVHSIGLAAILGVDKVSFGFTTGIDHLLDRHKNIWIYQKKPWMGISIGLNLN